MFEWYYSFIFLFIIHTVTGLVISSYLHRSLTHKYVIFPTNLQKFCRCWLWFIGVWEPRISVKKWAATHRKHHQLSDTVRDPHSPWNHSFFNTLIIMTGKADHRSPYVISEQDIEKYAPDVPEFTDKLEDTLIAYRRWPIFLFSGMFLLLFGIGGLAVGVVGYFLIMASLLTFNFVTHKYGYQNFENHKRDRSKNLWPIGFIYIGEEFQNNHHNQSGSIKFSVKWYEFDTCYAFIKILQYFGLAEIINRSDQPDQKLNE